MSRLGRRGVVLGALIVAAGCMRPQEGPRERLPRGRREIRGADEAEFLGLFKAAYAVLGRDYRLRYADPMAGTLYAESGIIGAPGGKTRHHVRAQIDRTPAGGYDVEVRVVAQVDVSLAGSYGYQPPYEWISLDFDPIEEARLIRLIHEEMRPPEKKPPEEIAPPGPDATALLSKGRL